MAAPLPLPLTTLLPQAGDSRYENSPIGNRLHFLSQWWLLALQQAGGRRWWVGGVAVHANRCRSLASWNLFPKSQARLSDSINTLSSSSRPAPTGLEKGDKVFRRVGVAPLRQSLTVFLCPRDRFLWGLEQLSTLVPDKTTTEIIIYGALHNLGSLFSPALLARRLVIPLSGRLTVPAEQMVHLRLPAARDSVSGAAELGLQSLDLLALSRGPGVFLSARVHPWQLKSV